MTQEAERENYVRRGTLAGLGTNFLLFCIKFFVGTFSASVSVLADAFNNLSDMGASLVALIGYRMAKKPSDEGHPFGHGRIEYISGLIISFIILLLGFELAKGAVEKIVKPVAVSFSALTICLLVLSVLAKLALGLYMRRIGCKIHSPALLAAGRDSFNDMVVTAATILSAVLSIYTAWPVDGVIGLGVSLFVIFSGIGILRDTLGPLLGQAPPPALVSEIGERVLACPGVTGMHDMIVHNYGPEQYIASVHAEVRDDCDILKIHDAIDLTERRILDELGVLITVHIDPIDTDDALTCKLRDMVAAHAREIDEGITMHDFRMVRGDTHTNLIFDLVLPRTTKLREAAVREELDRRLKGQNPSYFTVITFDRPFV